MLRAETGRADYAFFVLFEPLFLLVMINLMDDISVHEKENFGLPKLQKASFWLPDIRSFFQINIQSYRFFGYKCFVITMKPKNGPILALRKVFSVRLESPVENLKDFNIQKVELSVNFCHFCFSPFLF